MLIEVEVQDKEVLGALASAQSALRNRGPLFRTLANLQFRSTMRNFDSESFDGRKWPPLAHSTALAFMRSQKSRIRGYAEGGKSLADVQSYAQRVFAAGRGHTTGSQLKTKGLGARRGYQNILHPTGQLIRQKTHQSSTNEEARVSCGTSWAWVHNFGAPLQHFTMPRRTFLGVSQADNRAIIGAVEWHIGEAFRRGAH